MTVELVTYELDIAIICNEKKSTSLSSECLNTKISLVIKLMKKIKKVVFLILYIQLEPNKANIHLKLK